MAQLYIILFLVSLIAILTIIIYQAKQIRGRQKTNNKDLEDEIAESNERIIKTIAFYLKLFGAKTLTLTVKTYLFSKKGIKKGYANIKRRIRKIKLKDKKPIAFLSRKTKEYKQEIKKIKDDIEKKKK